MGLIFNGVIEAGIIADSNKFYGLMSVPFWEHLLIGSIYLVLFSWQLTLLPQLKQIKVNGFMVFS